MRANLDDTYIEARRWITWADMKTESVRNAEAL